ncbi:MAG: hypothetical protein ACLFNN_01955 [Candidatus Paceibacterota bacterium]
MASPAVMEKNRDVRFHPQARFKVKCSGDRSIEELLVFGRFDLSCGWMTSRRFPAKEEACEAEIAYLADFYEDPTHSQVEKRALYSGYQIPKNDQVHEAVIRFGIMYPKEQMKKPIVFVHEPVLGPYELSYVFTLFGKTGRRFLTLHPIPDRWLSECRFAALDFK